MSRTIAHRSHGTVTVRPGFRRLVALLVLVLLPASVPAQDLPEVTLARKVVGQIEANCYILKEPVSKAVVVIDPGADADGIAAEVRGDQGKLVGVLITHGHEDHIGGAGELTRALPGRVHLHPDDGAAARAVGLARFERIDDGQTVTLDTIRLKVIHLPGHSPGSVAFLLENPCAGEEKAPAGATLFSGDTLTARGIGRTQQPDQERQMLEAVQEKILGLPDTTRVLPGHGPGTSIGAMRPWLVPFIKERTGR